MLFFHKDLHGGTTDRMPAFQCLSWSTGNRHMSTEEWGSGRHGRGGETECWSVGFELVEDVSIFI